MAGLQTSFLSQVKFYFIYVLIPKLSNDKRNVQVAVSLSPWSCHAIGNSSKYLWNRGSIDDFLPLRVRHFKARIDRIFFFFFWTLWGHTVYILNNIVCFLNIGWASWSLTGTDVCISKRKQSLWGCKDGGRIQHYWKPTVSAATKGRRNCSFTGIGKLNMLWK